MSGFIEPISQKQCTLLHKRLINGDVTSSAEIAEMFFPLVRMYLISIFSSRYPEDLIEAAVTDAFTSYLKNPTQYNCQETSLGRYLVLSSHRDLIDLIRHESRCGLRGLPKNSQFVELDAANNEQEIEDRLNLDIEEQVSYLLAPVWTKLDILLPDAQDKKFVLMMMEGVRATSDYAAVLNITELPLVAQEAEVKKRKDRIKKILQRHLSRTDLEL